MAYRRRGALLRLALVLTLALASACSGPSNRAPARTDIGHPANAVLMRAIGLVGTPYRYGGNTPQGGFDCSGLVGFVYRDAAGLNLPRTTGEIATVRAPKVARDALAPGDLVLFGQRGRVDHIGIYVGEGRFVHAPSRGGTVRLDALNGHYWRDRFAGGRRLLR